MNRIIALSEAISLTDEILVLLDQEDFEGVSRLDAKRVPLIEAAFSGSIEEIDRIKAQHLQNLNEQVVERLNQLKEAVIKQQTHMRHASKATRAYQSNR